MLTEFTLFVADDFVSSKKTKGHLREKTGHLPSGTRSDHILN